RTWTRSGPGCGWCGSRSRGWTSRSAARPAPRPRPEVFLRLAPGPRFARVPRPMRAALLTAVAVAVLAAPACRGSSKPAAGPPATEDEKTLYALGMSIGQQLRVFTLSDAEVAMVERGLEDQVLKKKTEVELREYGPKLS